MAGTWARTITIEVEKAAQTVTHIQSTQDAARYLLDHWTKERSPTYCSAIRMCAKAIKGEASHEAAYITFMAAVREANVALISNRRGETPDQFELDVEQILAESILAELKAMWVTPASAGIESIA